MDSILCPIWMCKKKHSFILQLQTAFVKRQVESTKIKKTD